MVFSVCVSLCEAFVCACRHTCEGRLKLLLAGLRFLLFPVLLLDALPAEFLLLRLFVAGLAGSAVNQNTSERKVNQH